MKRKIRVAGEKAQLVCNHCEAVRSATWNYDDFALDDGTIVSGVMVAHCDECGEQAGLAAQSSYLIRQAREEKQKRLRTNVTMSRPLLDLAESRLHNAGSSTMNSVEAVILAVLAAMRKSAKNHNKVLQLLKEAAKDPLLKNSKWDQRIPIRLNRKAENMLREITEAEGFNRSEFVRRAVLLEDREINENIKQFALV